jgi:hypothetical protein
VKNILKHHTTNNCPMTMKKSGQCKSPPFSWNKKFFTDEVSGFIYIYSPDITMAVSKQIRFDS